MIIHVDMDAFYAAVEELDSPELAGRAVIVGGSPQGRGVVATANYAARKFGVHSAMSMSQAMRLCPQAVVRPGRMARYQAISARIHAIFARYTPEIEPLSLDEAFLDVRGSEKLFGGTAPIARRIKQEILDELGLVASVGVAPNKFLAKIASDLEKPDGFVVVTAAQSQAFLDPLPVGRLWGVGQATAAIFERLGIGHIGEVRRQSPELMQRYFGTMGQHLLELAQGIDPRPVVSERQAKSISRETTFPVDVADAEVLRARLMSLCEQVSGRLRQHGLKGRTVQLKLRYADFQTLTRARSLPEPSDHTDELWQTCWRLFCDHWRSGQPIRLIGMGVSGLHGSAPAASRQADLFATPHKQHLQVIDAITDDIQSRYGQQALQRGTSLRAAPGQSHQHKPPVKSQE
ncbi:MAG: DNA polymerase IV [Gammaproteobacteria bacterium]